MTGNMEGTGTVTTNTHAWLNGKKYDTYRLASPDCQHCGEPLSTTDILIGIPVPGSVFVAHIVCCGGGSDE